MTTNSKKNQGTIHVWIGSVIALAVVSLFVFYLYTHNIAYKISEDEIVVTFKNKTTQCSKLSECDLEPGDILIRKYSTEHTKYLEFFTDTYFTHAGYYSGENNIIEAIGVRRDKDSEITITEIDTSNWLEDKEDAFVVLRSNTSNPEIESQQLKEIANSEATFGLRDGKFTCSSLIYHVVAGDVTNKNTFELTPDYLFNHLLGEGYDILGYKTGL